MIDHPGRAPATVWLHHGVGSARSWSAFLPASAGGRRALAYSRLGFGGSPHAREFTPAIFDEDCAELADLLDARGGRPAHLVGHSDGGTAALLYAARFPSAVLTVTVIATHVRADAGTIGTLCDMGPPRHWPLPMRRRLELDHGDDWADVAGAWHALWTAPAFAGWSIVDELPRVTAPVLAIHARRDALSPPVHAHTLARSIPGAAVLWVDSDTHDPHRVDRAGFLSALTDHWARAERSHT